MPQDKEKIKKLAQKVVDNNGSTTLAILGDILEIKDKIPLLESTLADLDKKVQSVGDKIKEPDYTGILDSLTNMQDEIKKKDFRGLKGDAYILTALDKKEIALMASASIKVPIVEKVIEKTETVREIPTVTEVVKQVAVYETGEEIIKKINSVSGIQIDASHIANLPQFTREVIREIGGHAGAMETPLKDAATGRLLPKDASGAWLISASSGGGTWGSITGTLSAQTDLQTALNGKVSTATTLTAGTGLTGGGDLSANRTFSIDSTVATLTGAQALSNKTGLISQWTNDSGYLTSSSGVTSLASSDSSITFSSSTGAVNATLNGFTTTDSNGLSHLLAGNGSAATPFYVDTNQNVSWTGTSTYKHFIYTGDLSNASATFFLNTSGNITLLNGVTTSFPSSQGGALTFLQNDGAGNLSWVDGGGGVTSVSGTTNRITSTGGATPVIDISASYVGQSSITTLGTIGTGVWQGTKVAEGFGGTNQSTYTLGDTLYSSAANTLSKLAGNTTSTKKFLTQTGTGTVSAAPGWNTISAGDVPTLNQNTTGSAAFLTTGRTISITGDLAYTSPSFDGSGNVTASGTLATVNTNTGSWGTATQVGQFTVNGKGLITAAANVTITPAESSITFTDITTGNVTSTKHGYAPKSPADATQFLNGAATPAYAQVKDSDLATTDITTNNVSTSKHGFTPKLSNSATDYLSGTGVYTKPSSGDLVYVDGSVPGGNTVANTTTPTTITSTYTITGGTLVAGNVIRIFVSGLYSTALVAPNITVQLKIGSTVVGTTGSITAVAGVTNGGFTGFLDFVVTNAGASGTGESQGYAEFATAATTSLSVNLSNTAAITGIDFTANQAITLVVTWGTANASNTVTFRQFMVWIDKISSILGATAGGDLSGTYPNPTVAKINGVTLGSTTATAGNLLIGSGSQWVSTAVTGDVTISSGGVTAIGSGKVLTGMLNNAVRRSDILFGSGSLNPLNATTYYWGNFPSLAPSTTAGNKRIYFPIACTIVAVSLFAWTNGGVSGTSETSTISLRVNNTTDTTLTSTAAFNTLPVAVQATGLSISINAGDYVEIKWVTPTWVTKPTGLFMGGTISTQ